MSDYVTLLGAENVQRAGHGMSAAADRMQQVAASFDESVRRLILALEEHAARIEQATRPTNDR